MTSVTDFVWRKDSGIKTSAAQTPREAHVTADAAIANLMKNAGHAQAIAAEAIKILGRELPSSAAHTALDSALVTGRDSMAAGVKSRLEAFWS